MGSTNVKFLLQQDPIIGGSLLLTYTTGYVAPLLLAASFAGALQVPRYLYIFLLKPFRGLPVSYQAVCHYALIHGIGKLPM